MSKYVLPDFSAYRPQLIQYSIKEVERSYLHKVGYENKHSKEKYEKAFLKIYKKEELNKRDLKALSHNLISLEKSNKFEVFYNAFVMKINKLPNKTYFIRPFLSYVYNGENTKYKQFIYNILKSLAKLDLKYKERYSNIFSVINKSNSVDDFIMNIENRFSDINNQNAIQKVCEDLFIKSTDAIYHKCIIVFIYKNYLNDNLWTFNRNKINTLSLPLKKELFKKILLQYEKNLDIKTYPEQWFKLIGKELGDPYDNVNQRWRNLEEEKEIFRRWNVSENMDEFFDKIVGGDKRRKAFWRNYVDNVYRIEYFEEASQALVMEFKDHLFIEFAEYNNAMYYYDKGILNINEIKSKLRDIMMSSSKKTKYLKQKDIAIGKHNHGGAWEYKFDYTMKSLGYMKSRWS